MADKKKKQYTNEGMDKSYRHLYSFDISGNDKRAIKAVYKPDLDICGFARDIRGNHSALTRCDRHDADRSLCIDQSELSIQILIRTGDDMR